MKSEDVFKKLLSQYHESKLSHAFLLVTNDTQKCETDLKNFIKQISCPNVYSCNCNIECNICRLIDINQLSDVITIYPENNVIKKESIINLKNEFVTKSNYISKKIYIISNADKMNNYSSNSLLKFFEEPEQNILGFLITANKEKVLSTIISRCECLQIKYDESINSLDNQIIAEINKIADKVIIDIEQKRILDLFVAKNMIIEMLDTKEKSLYFFERIFSLYGLALNDKKNLTNDINSILSKLSINQLVKRLKIMDNINRDAKYNVNLDIFINKMYIEMVDSNE